MMASMRNLSIGEESDEEDSHLCRPSVSAARAFRTFTPPMHL